jgi:hypothetical protein
MWKLIVYSGILMGAMREAWTDERLDDLRDQVDRRFDQVDIRFDKVDARFDKFEDRVEARFDRIDDRFEKLEERLSSRFDSLWRMMLAGYITAVFGLIAAQL